MVLIELDSRFNTLGKSNINFKWAQSLRLGMLLIITIIVFLMFYILARIAFFYLNVWSLVIFFIALLLISFSAGRKVV